MQNFRYLLAAIAALTLLMSVVSSVNPTYFAGLSAFADDDKSGTSGSEKEGQDDSQTSQDSSDDNATTSTVNEEQNGGQHEDKGQQENDHGKQQEQEQEAKSKLRVETEYNGVKIEVELEGLNMTDGSYDAVFTCEEPASNVTLDNAFEVNDGAGKLAETVGLANGTYNGCEITVEGKVIASADTFTVSAGTEEEQENNVEEKRKERREHLVSTLNGTEIHERHRSEKAFSPGEYEPGWNYTLAANGTALTHDGNKTSNEGDATIQLNMAVWKSTGSLILLDVLDGKVEMDNETYTVVLGYAYYTVQHDAFKLGALAVDEGGNIYKLKLRGSAVDEEAGFPMESGLLDLESGSLDLNFGGSSQSINRLGDWDLAMDGSITAD